MGDVELLASRIRSYGRARDLAHGREIHDEIRGSRHRHNRFLANLVVDMYGRCGSTRDALAAFESIRSPNSFSWNVVISAFARNGAIDAALALFDRMPESAKREEPPVAWNCLISACGEGGRARQARDLFDRMPSRDEISWNAMLAAYARAGICEESRLLFDRMPNRDIVSWNTLLAAYGRSGRLDLVQSTFDAMEVRNSVTWNTLLTAYAEHGHMREAVSLLDSMPENLRDAVTATIMVTAYSQQGNIEKSIKVYSRLKLKDAFSASAIIHAYAQHGHLHEAREIFDKAPHHDIVSWNSMLGAYVKNGKLDKAEDFFQEMPIKDVVSWNSMVVAFSHSGDFAAAIRFFSLMDLDGVQPDNVTFLAAVDACGSLGNLVLGRSIHSDIFHPDILLANALIIMYSRCSSLQAARDVFFCWPHKDVVLWTSIVSSYAENSRGQESLHLFQSMQLDGVSPDTVTFTTILSKCAQAGLLHAARVFFSCIPDHGLAPKLDHFICMVDALGRSGWVAQAAELVNSMPYEPDSVAWTSLLAACNFHDHQSEIGEAAARRAVLLHPSDSTPYLLLSNLHSQSQSSSSIVQNHSS